MKNTRNLKQISGLKMYVKAALIKQTKENVHQKEKTRPKQQHVTIYCNNNTNNQNNLTILNEKLKNVIF